ncbi:MAG TPA: AraC family transcriptional regulator ligand-binding domain-containing protein [Kofleriaceae bacterium]|nr:AraC family transcriptional regulator ligand-binding domain-containing protein [Kofleriaceae bacterium]
MDKTIVFDPGGIATTRTSVERVLGRAPARRFASADDFPEYWREAIAMHGSEDLALRIANELPVGGFGRASYAFASSATIGDAFQAFRRDAQRFVSGWTVELLRGKGKGKGDDGGDAELVIRGPEPVWPVIEFVVAVMALRCQQLPDPPVAISRVVLPRPRPQDAGPWEQLFTVMPEFGARHGALVIDAALLTRPLRTADESVRKALGSAYTETIVDQVRAHVREWIRDSPEADEVARALGLSTRTLQRRLGEEGTSFRDVVLAVKIDVAKELLEQPQLSIAEVASAVGFTRVPAFSRAFSQRTGMTPTAFRASLGGGPASSGGSGVNS